MTMCKIIAGLLLLVAIAVILFPGKPSKAKRYLLCISLYFAIIAELWYVERIGMFSTGESTWSGIGYWILCIIYLPSLIIGMPPAYFCDLTGLKGVPCFILIALWTAFFYICPVWLWYGKYLSDESK